MTASWTDCVSGSGYCDERVRGGISGFDSYLKGYNGKAGNGVLKMETL